MADEFVMDREEWRRQWEALSELERYEIIDATGHGRAVRRPELAPLMALHSRRHRNQVVPGMLLLPLVAAAMSLFMGDDTRAALIVTVVFTLAAGAGALLFEWLHQAAVERNRAVLLGASVEEAAAREPRGKGLRLARWVGGWLLAFWITGAVLRLVAAVGWAILRAFGVELDADHALTRVALVGWVPVALVITWVIRRAMAERG